MSLFQLYCYRKGELIQKIVFEMTVLFDDQMIKAKKSSVRLIFNHNFLSLVNEFSEIREKWFCELRTDFFQFCLDLSGFHRLSWTSIFVDSFEDPKSREKSPYYHM